jgi:hypothetical protein
MRAADFTATTDPGTVWRIGYAPNPWAWSDWKYADDNGLFNGRWDDQHGRFRTIYTAESLLGCFLEVLAQLRPDPNLTLELDFIADDDNAEVLYPTTPAGVVGYEWLEEREWATGVQTGTYCFVTTSESVATLAQTGVFARFGVVAPDIGTDVLKDPHTRPLTRTIARMIYDVRHEDKTSAFDGVEFRSRHGNELRMWAMFERGTDEDARVHVKPHSAGPVDPDNSDLLAAFTRLGLRWPED